jgi:hypothetical protein
MQDSHALSVRFDVASQDIRGTWLASGAPFRRRSWWAM